MTGIDKIARLVDWDDLSVFLAIINTGSISKAANILGRTQPTISKRIEKLEYRLGASLFERTPSGMIATSVGQAILTHAEAMNRSAANIERMATDFNDTIDGEVMIKCLDGLVSDWIIPRTPKFQEHNQKINLNFCHQSTNTASLEREPDLNIQFDTKKPMDFLARQMGTLHYVPMVSQKYKDSNGIPKTMQDVVNYHLMFLRRSGLVADTWEKRSLALRELVTPSLSSNSCSVILSSVLNGAGISMLPTYMAMLHPELIMLDYGVVYSYKFWLVQSPYAAKLKRVQIASDWLSDVFSNDKHPCFQSDYIHPRNFSDIQVQLPS